jgi:hypothetical protein
MNIKIKLEIAKIFILDFECSSSKKKEETSNEKKESANTAAPSK